MPVPFPVDEILNAQLEEVIRWHEKVHTVTEPQSFPELTTLLNHYNFSLWHEEDLARDPDVSDAEIARCKRAIDRYNQQRNDTIERVDEAIIHNLMHAGVSAEDAPMNSETPGSIFDRLSINALKVFHMREQTERTDADAAHIAKCQERLAIITEQRKDLSNCLKTLLEELFSGQKRLKVYRQMKMYNDPSLNPMLYGKELKQ